MKSVDIIGTKFGTLRVTHQMTVGKGNEPAMFMCQCECGTLVVVNKKSLTDKRIWNHCGKTACRRSPPAPSVRSPNRPAVAKQHYGRQNRTPKDVTVRNTAARLAIDAELMSRLSG